MVNRALFRDCEAYLVGKLCAPGIDMPVVFSLLNKDGGIVVDAILAGREDMRNLLFVSTRSTFCVRVERYRELLDFLDSLAPQRGHPAMCAVIGFTHPARVGSTRVSAAISPKQASVLYPPPAALAWQ